MSRRIADQYVIDLHKMVVDYINTNFSSYTGKIMEYLAYTPQQIVDEHDKYLRENKIKITEMKDLKQLIWDKTWFSVDFFITVEAQEWLWQIYVNANIALDQNCLPEPK